MKLYLFTLLMACLGAHAQVTKPNYIDIYGASYHFTAEGTHDDGYNERNTGIGATWAGVNAMADLDVTVGAYRNSLNRLTVHAGATKNLFRSGAFEAGVTGGLATGYGIPVTPYMALKSCYRFTCVQATPALPWSIGVVAVTLRIPV